MSAPDPSEYPAIEAEYARYLAELSEPPADPVRAGFLAGMQCGAMIALRSIVSAQQTPPSDASFYILRPTD